MPERSGSGRPRPVADAVVGALADRAEDVARGWLVALLEGRPLAEAAAIPVADVAAAGPELCRSVLDAVASDDALDALARGPHGDVLAALAGRGDGPELVAAAEALRRAVLTAAESELPRAQSAVMADLSDRLAHVCARLAAAAMTARAARSGGGEGAAASRPGAGGGEPVDEDLASSEPSPVELVHPRPEEPGGTRPLWLAALERRLADGGRFALMLVELDGADRLRLAEGEDAARELFARTGRAVRGALRRVDQLAHEQNGRMWVIAPDAGRPGAAALADRVANAVEAAASARGVPLTASVGLALFPDDGRDVDSLTAQAEEAALAAQASGTRVGGGTDGRSAAQGPRLVP